MINKNDVYILFSSKLGAKVLASFKEYLWRESPIDINNTNEVVSVHARRTLIRDIEIIMQQVKNNRVNGDE